MGRIVSVNMEGVESGGGSVRIPEGDYGFKVTKVIKKTGDKGDYLRISLKAQAGPAKGIGKTLDHICSLTKNSLWNLRNLMEAAGKAVPSKAIKIDLDKMVGWTLAATVVDDTYKNKPKSSIAAFFPLADLGKAEETEETEEDTESESDDTESESDDTEEAEEEGEEIFT